MSDIDRENQASSPVQVTGGDEAYKADVIEDLDGKKKLFVKATVTDGDVTVSNNLRIIEDQSVTNINVGSWTNRYTSFTGAGVCSGFMIRGNTTRFRVQLIADSVELFDIDCDFLQGLINWNNSANPSAWVSFNSSSNTFYFYPFLPLKFDTDLEINCRSTQGNRQIIGSYIQVAEIV